MRRAAQRVFWVFRRFGSNAGAKTARRHIDKTGLSLTPAISLPSLPAIASFRLSSASGNTGAGGKSLAKAKAAKGPVQGLRRRGSG